MSRRRPAAAPAMWLRLVAVVRDGDRILACRNHDAAIWRLPSAPWDAGSNPVEAVRELLAQRAGVIVSPILHAPVKFSATAGLLLFTAKPLNVPPVGTQLCRWVTAQNVLAVLPPSDQQWVFLTSAPPPQQRISSATQRQPPPRLLTAEMSGTVTASQKTG